MKKIKLIIQYSLIPIVAIIITPFIILAILLPKKVNKYPICMVEFIAKIL